MKSKVTKGRRFSIEDPTNIYYTYLLLLFTTIIIMKLSPIIDRRMQTTNPKDLVRSTDKFCELTTVKTRYETVNKVIQKETCKKPLSATFKSKFAQERLAIG